MVELPTPFADVLDRLACPQPGCAGALEAIGLDTSGHGGDGWLGCTACDEAYPVVAGVPLLVVEVAEYVSSYREGLLATLAEMQRLTPEGLNTLEAARAGAAHAEPLRWGDDWTAGEGAAGSFDGEAWSDGLAGQLASWLASARGEASRAPLRELAAGAEWAEDGWLAEIGPGARPSALDLAPLQARIVVIDRSLRAALLSAARLNRAGIRAWPVVGEAEALPLTTGGVEGVLAENVVDLLDAPEGFLEELRRVLAPHGAAVLTTPDPTLGSGMPGTLEDAMASAHLTVEGRADGVPWLREHTDRHVQIYLDLALRIRRA